MITVYETGSDLIRENKALLDTAPLLSVFFMLDGPAITHPDKVNYVIRAERDDRVLLAMRAEPYSLLLFGDPEPADELADFLMRNDYTVKGLMGSESVCGRMAALLDSRYGIRYREALAMDFMQASEQTEPSSPDVETPTDADLPELAALTECFIIDCGLTDEVDPDGIRASLDSYRVIRADGLIVSMAKSAPSADFDLRISSVYTRPGYRGQKYARRVVNTLKNEILGRGRTATLTVDRNNPISNRLYESLGFVRVCSIGEYRRD
ncbi:MAG: GNAT family N-acetyltransferase [Clostridia bacterium]|nr:GNAT family N-acetyltransferase [Clostridia bacterium]